MLPPQVLRSQLTITSLASNTPDSVNPDSDISVPAGVTVGDWVLCAKIDPANNVSETDETDNVVFAEKPFAILEHGDHNCP